MEAREKKLFIVFTAAVILLFGCQGPGSFERSVSLVPAGSGDPNIVAEPVDPLEVLATVEKIAADGGLEVYHTDAAEADLLDMTDADLLGDSGGPTNVTEYKHPELGVYLTVTRTPEEILILLNYTPDANGKSNSGAVKLYKTIEEQLTEMIAELNASNDFNANQ